MAALYRLLAVLFAFSFITTAAQGQQSDPPPFDPYVSVKPYAITAPANGILTGNLVGEVDKASLYFENIAEPFPDRIFKIQVPGPNGSLLVYNRGGSLHQLFLLDTAGYTGKVNDASYNYGAPLSFKPVLRGLLTGGTNYLIIEQGSQTTADANYDIQLFPACMPTYTEANLFTYPGGTTRDIILNNQVFKYTPNNLYANSPENDPLPLNIGTNNSITVPLSTPNTIPSPTPAYFRVFIDFNGDGDFSDAGELIYAQKTASNGITDNFILPTTNPLYAGAVGKVLQMRLILQPTVSTIDPCGNLGLASVTNLLVRVNSPSGSYNPNVDFRWARPAYGGYLTSFFNYTSPPLVNDGGYDKFSRVRSAIDGSHIVGGDFFYATNATFYPANGYYFQMPGTSGQGGLFKFFGTSGTQYTQGGVVGKYGRDGSFKWGSFLVSAGTPGTTTTGTVDVRGISVDKNGYTLACGSFNGKVKVYDATGIVTDLVATQTTGGWIAQFNPNGKLVFIFPFGNISSVDVNAVDVTPDGKFYVAGSFRGTSTFQGVSGQAYTLVGRGNYDAFLAKFTGIGTMYWILQGGGTGNDFGYGAAADKNGTGYLLGSFESTASFTSSISGTTGVTKVSAGGSDGFVLSVSNAGTLQWVTTMGGATNENVKDVAPDPRGTGLVAVGSFSNVATFGSTVLSSIGFYDAFATRLNLNGAFEWATKAGYYGQDFGNSVRLDKNGNAWVGINFSQTIASPFGGPSITSTGGFDGALIKLDAATGLATTGYPIGQIKGISDESVLGIDTVDGGGAVAVGSYNAGVLFGQLGSFPNLGYTDAFVSRFSAPASGIAREAEGNQLGTMATRLMVFPNPATGQVNIKMPRMADGFYPLTIVDMQGRVVYSETFDADALASGVPVTLKPVAGLYLVRCAGQTTKLMVE